MKNTPPVEKLTPWFPANVKPARPGVYIAIAPEGDAAYSYWGGAHWSPVRPTIESACRTQHLTAVYQNKKWRGLAQPPK